MIDYLDALLRQLFKSRVPGLRTPNPVPGQPPLAVVDGQIGFRAPDDNWRSYVSNLTVNNQSAKAINVYLIDIKENRKLRSNERIRDEHDGMVFFLPAEQRLDCHYLISAWSPALVNLPADATADDEFLTMHALLYQAAAALLRGSPLVPREIFAPGPLPPFFPLTIADAQLPTMVLPGDGFVKLAEFWAGMGTKHGWLPTLYVTITIPVVMDAELAGFPISARVMDSGLGGTGLADRWVEIRGQVVNAATHPPTPVADAWVRLEEIGGIPLRQVTTDGNGNYIFDKLQAGSYRVYVRAQGFAPKIQQIDVPASSGDYTIELI